jgi:hypothetical protein
VSKGYDIRAWQAGDEVAIRELFQASFGRTLAADFWAWRFNDHPAGEPLIMLAWQGDRLAGHYAASQAPLTCDGQIIPAALSMTTMTHPKDRGHGLIEAVGGALYEMLGQNGYAGVWGFPNAMINATRRRKLGWVPIDDVPTLSLNVAAARARGADPALKVSIVDNIDGRFEALQQATAQPDTLAGLRSTATLEWRIDKNPINTYTRYIISAGEQIAGYAITKAFGSQAIDIVDICALDDAHVTALLASVLKQAQIDGVGTINCWCLRMDPARIAFERFGFAATAPVTYFAGRSFDPELRGFSDARRWRLSMLDSDLF